MAASGSDRPDGCAASQFLAPPRVRSFKWPSKPLNSNVLIKAPDIAETSAAALRGHSEVPLLRGRPGHQTHYERTSNRRNSILKRPSFRAGIALQPAAPNPFMRPRATTNHPAQCRQRAPLPVLTECFTPCLPPQMGTTSTAHFTLSP